MSDTVGQLPRDAPVRLTEATAPENDASGPARGAPLDAPQSTGAGAMLAELKRALSGRPEAVPLRDLVAAMEGNSFPVLTLLFALLLVSPLSAIPGATTLFGLAIAAILLQWIMGRRRVWLPAMLLDRRLPVGRTTKALDWLRGPVAWVECRLRRRQRWVFVEPFARGPLALALAAALCTPLFEVIPGSGTSFGAAIALFGAGILARDGLVVLAGACLAAVLPVSLWLLLT